MPRKYYEYDLTSVVELIRISPQVFRDMHVLFRQAMARLGKITFWKDSDGSEYCACWDTGTKHMHSDLYREEYKTLIIEEVKAHE
jgi:hypothetical protein